MVIINYNKNNKILEFYTINFNKDKIEDTNDNRITYTYNITNPLKK